MITAKPDHMESSQKASNSLWYSWYLPISSPLLLKRKVDVRKTKMFGLKSLTISEGLVFDQIPNYCYIQVDATQKLTRGSSIVIVAGTVTCNVDFRFIALALANAETTENISSFLQSIDEATETLFPDVESSSI